MESDKEEFECGPIEGSLEVIPAINFLENHLNGEEELDQPMLVRLKIAPPKKGSIDTSILKETARIRTMILKRDDVRCFQDFLLRNWPSRQISIKITPCFFFHY